MMTYLQRFSDDPKASRLRSRVFMLAACWVGAVLPAGTSAADVDPEYWQVVMGRADAIVAPMELIDAVKEGRVREAIARHYVDLSGIHDSRDAAIASLREHLGDYPAMLEPAIDALRRGSDAEVRAVHYAFVGKLSADLTAEQVVAVKDGLTYGVAPNTYNVYLAMLPDLTEEQKAQIMAWIVEAREYAMNAGSAGEKHGWFGKYKGRINNYLSSLGYDLKEAERRMRDEG